MVAINAKEIYRFEVSWPIFDERWVFIFFQRKCRLGMSFKWYQVFSAAENLFAVISNVIKSHSSFALQIISLTSGSNLSLL